jgi:hypothetical protein
MPVQKPETTLQKKLEALERYKAMMDSLATFLKAHPKIAAECSIHRLHGKLALKFDEYTVVVPYVKKGGVFVLRLVKSGEDWYNTADSDDLYGKSRVASEDVSGMSDDELEKLLDSVYREANPDADDEDDSESVG